MAITHLVTGYAGVEHIQAADDGAFNAAFFGDGQYVMESGSMFEGSIIDNNTVRILDGDLLMYGRHVRIKPDTYEDLTITTGTAGTNRIDLICVTYEKNANDGTETAYFEVIRGAEATGTAVAPSYVNGNILEGATKNQMPMYKVTIAGVVLSNIESVFTIIPTYKTLAEMYAEEFQQACETHLGTLDILDTMEEIEANTLEKQVAGALALKEMKIELDDCFQSVSDGKALIASAITGKRVSTDATATFAQMAANIDAIVLGSGTAQKAHVLAGKTFTNDDGVEYTGEMVDNAGKTVTASEVSSDDDYTYLTIPTTAYYSNASKVKTANSNLKKVRKMKIGSSGGVIGPNEMLARIEYAPRNTGQLIFGINTQSAAHTATVKFDVYYGHTEGDAMTTGTHLGAYTVTATGSGEGSIIDIPTSENDTFGFVATVTSGYAQGIYYSV